MIYPVSLSGTDKESPKYIFASIPGVRYICINFAFVDRCNAVKQPIQVLKVVLATFLLVCLVSLKESTCEINVIFISKVLLILEIIKF